MTTSAIEPVWLMETLVSYRDETTRRIHAGVRAFLDELSTDVFIGGGRFARSAPTAVTVFTETGYGMNDATFKELCEVFLEDVNALKDRNPRYDKTHLAPVLKENLKRWKGFGPEALAVAPVDLSTEFTLWLTGVGKKQAYRDLSAMVKGVVNNADRKDLNLLILPKNNTLLKEQAAVERLLEELRGEAATHKRWDENGKKIYHHNYALHATIEEADKALVKRGVAELRSILEG